MFIFPSTTNHWHIASGKDDLPDFVRCRPNRFDIKVKDFSITANWVINNKLVVCLLCSSIFYLVVLKIIIINTQNISSNINLLNKKHADDLCFIFLCMLLMWIGGRAVHFWLDLCCLWPPLLHSHVKVLSVGRRGQSTCLQPVMSQCLPAVWRQALCWCLIIVSQQHAGYCHTIHSIFCSTSIGHFPRILLF